MAAVEALDYQTALQCFEKALAEGEDLRLLYRGQGLAYMGLTQYDKAAEAFEKALGSGNGRIDEHNRQHSFFCRIAFPCSFHVNLFFLCRPLPCYDINYYLATTYYKLGQTEQGIRTYNAILALKPVYSPLIFHK